MGPDAGDPVGRCVLHFPELGDYAGHRGKVCAETGQQREGPRVRQDDATFCPAGVGTGGEGARKGTHEGEVVACTNLI